MEKVSIKMCERKRGTTNQMTTSDASSFDKKMRLHRDTLAGSSERLSRRYCDGTRIINLQFAWRHLSKSIASVSFLCGITLSLLTS
jgi:hypothetical protein